MKKINNVKIERVTSYADLMARVPFYAENLMDVSFVPHIVTLCPGYFAFALDEAIDGVDAVLSFDPNFNWGGVEAELNQCIKHWC